MGHLMQRRALECRESPGIRAGGHQRRDNPGSPIPAAKCNGVYIRRLRTSTTLLSAINRATSCASPTWPQCAAGPLATHPCPHPSLIDTPRDPPSGGHRAAPSGGKRIHASAAVRERRLLR
jgi:hypothetical protein